MRPVAKSEETIKSILNRITQMSDTDLIMAIHALDAHTRLGSTRKSPCQCAKCSDSRNALLLMHNALNERKWQKGQHACNLPNGQAYSENQTESRP